MAARNLALKIDVSQVEGLAKRLDKISAAELAPLLVSTVNDVADRSYVMSRDLMRAGLNLTDEYLRRRMPVRKATAGKPSAEIKAEYGGIAISHFDANQWVKPTISPIRRLKGDAARGIPRGQKQGGVSVEVTRGGRKLINLPGVFIAPRIRDTEGNPFVFQRQGGRTGSGKDKLRRLFGPAPYQLFKFQLPKIEEPIADDMRETLLAQLDDWLGREFDT